MGSVKYLTLEEVLIIHEQQIEAYGGRSGLRDLALNSFESSFSRCKQTHLNRFCFDFLELNGYEVNVKRGELVKAALSIEEKSWGVEDIARWLEDNSEEV